MGALPRSCLLGGICAAVLLVAVLAHGGDAEPETASMVVGFAKCADCARKNMKAEAVFNGLQVAVKCKNAAGVFATKAVGEIDKSGAFSVPLAADLLREDGELKQDCFAQLHSAANQPCPGQEPSWIVRPASDSEYDDDKMNKIFVAVAGKVHYPSRECASVFLCFYFHKHLFRKTTPAPHIHKKKPVPAPWYKPPTTKTTPAVPVYRSPVPEYTPHPHHPTPTPIPIYYSLAEAEHKTPNPETDPEKFKKLLPFIKRNPFFPKFPKFPKFRPGVEEIKA